MVKDVMEPDAPKVHEGGNLLTVAKIQKQDILLEKLAFNIKKFNKSNLRGFFALGTNGEFRSLSTYEQNKVLKTGVKIDMDLAGFYGGPTHAPLPYLTADERRKLQEGLLALGYLKGEFFKNS